MKRFVSIMLAAVLLLAMPTAAFAEFIPSAVLRPDFSIIKAEAFDEEGNPVQVVIGPGPVADGIAIDVKTPNGTAVDDLNYGFILLTPYNEAYRVNKELAKEYAKKGESIEEHLDDYTKTGLRFIQNESIIDLQQLAVSSKTVTNFELAHGQEVLEDAKKAFPDELEQYDLVLTYNVYPNDIAKEILGEKGLVKLTVEYRNVSEVSKLMLQRDHAPEDKDYVEITEDGQVNHGSVEFLDAGAGKEKFSFDYQGIDISTCVLFAHVVQAAK